MASVTLECRVQHLHSHSDIPLINGLVFLVSIYVCPCAVTDDDDAYNIDNSDDSQSLDFLVCVHVL